MIYTGSNVGSNILTVNDWNFDKFSTLFRDPKRFGCTLAEFFSLEKKKQDTLKDGSYYVASCFIQPIRKKAFATNFSLLVIDLDNDLNFDPKQMPPEYRWIVHTTAKHHEFGPRYRVIVDVPTQPVSKYVETLDVFCKQFNIAYSPESKNYILPMFFPRVPSDSQYKVFINLKAEQWMLTRENQGLPEIVFPQPIAPTPVQTSLVYQQPPLAMDDEEVTECLNHIDPNCDYVEWVKIGSALRHQYQENPIDGLTLFDKWSSGGATYNKTQTARELFDKLKPYPETGEPVTVAYLKKLAAPFIKKEKKVTKFNPEDITPKAPPADGTYKIPNKLPQFAQNFILVTGANEYHDFVSQESFSTKIVNQCFNHYIPGSMSALNYLSKLPLKRAENYIYLPTKVPAIPPIYQHQGKKFVNTYRPAKLEPFTPEDATFVDKVINKHFTWLFGNNDRKDIMLSFIAYPIQTCEKIEWVPVVQGISGIGKTIIAEIVKNAVGLQNAALIDAKKIKGEYNSWASMKQFIFIDELRRHGSLSFFDSLRTTITDKEVSIQKKYQELSPNIPNVSNFMMFTEHKTALMLEQHDRRYVPLWSTVSVESLKIYEQSGNFRDISKICRPEYSSCVLSFFERYKVYKGFSAHKPPTTEERGIICEISKSSLEMVFDDLIENNTHPHINQTFVSTKALFDYMENNYKHSDIEYSTISRFLTEKGFTRLNKRLKVDGVLLTAYINNKHSLTSETIHNYNKFQRELTI